MFEGHRHMSRPVNFLIAQNYSEVSCFFDQKFNYPIISESFSIDDFAREYDSAFDVLAEALSAVGAVDTDGSGNGDFSMSRYVPLNRSITVVTDTLVARSLASIVAAHTALQRLSEEYVFSFDVHPSYVSVCRDGTAIGHATNGDLSILRAFGFPTVDS